MQQAARGYVKGSSRKSQGADSQASFAMAQCPLDRCARMGLMLQPIGMEVAPPTRPKQNCRLCTTRRQQMQQEIPIAAAGHLVCWSKHPIVDGSTASSCENPSGVICATARWPWKVSEFSPRSPATRCLSGRNLARCFAAATRARCTHHWESAIVRLDELTASAFVSSVAACLNSSD